MIAYNHYIKFIPELTDDRKVESPFSDVITVQESSFPNLNKKLLYEMTSLDNQGRDLSLYTDREFSRTVKGELWAIEVKDVVTFFWKSGTLIIEYNLQKNFTQELLKYWCLHIILPTFFTIEETYGFLHAGAVETDGKAILFVAESFGGKSTMTDFFMRQGHTMISDDKVALYKHNNQFYAVPSHPHHRPYRQLEDLGFFVNNFSLDPKQIHAIYELKKVDQGSEVAIIELKGIEKFRTLRYASEINLFFQKKIRFEFLTNVVGNVSIFQVQVPWNIKRLDDVYKAIVKHSKIF